jgi:hypothetical protein
MKKKLVALLAICAFALATTPTIVKAEDEATTSIFDGKWCRLELIDRDAGDSGLPNGFWLPKKEVFDRCLTIENNKVIETSGEVFLEKGDVLDDLQYVMNGLHSIALQAENAESYELFGALHAEAGKFPFQLRGYFLAEYGDPTGLFRDYGDSELNIENLKESVFERMGSLKNEHLFMASRAYSMPNIQHNYADGGDWENSFIFERVE